MSALEKRTGLVPVLQQTFTSKKKGAFLLKNAGTTQTLQQFRIHAAEAAAELPIADIPAMRQLYEHSLSKQRATYATDLQLFLTAGCALDLGSNKKCLLQELKRMGIERAGVTDPFTYVASPFATFGMHIEDMHCSSANLLLAGEPKIWYVVSPA